MLVSEQFWFIVLTPLKKKMAGFEKYSTPAFAINFFASRRFSSIYDKFKKKIYIFPIG